MLVDLGPFGYEMARTTGLEPATSGVTGRRSDQLSYVPREGAAADVEQGRYGRCQAERAPGDAGQAWASLAPRLPGTAPMWLDLLAPIEPPEPSTLPVLGWLPSLPDLAATDLRRLVDMLVATAPSLRWRRTYGMTDTSPAFLVRYGWTELVGPHGLYAQRGGTIGLPPARPRHALPAARPRDRGGLSSSPARPPGSATTALGATCHPAAPSTTRPSCPTPLAPPPSPC